VRVIAGSARGTKLVCPEGLSVRPTHDRVKEAVFSMLTGHLVGASVLDLFTGTGALSVEALSRGAENAVLVDASARSLETAKVNLEKTRLLDKARLVKADYLSFLQGTANQFDLIFLDPPYQGDYLKKALEAIKSYQLLKADGIIYCETEGEPPTEAAALFQVVRDKKYGRARVLLLKEL